MDSVLVAALALALGILLGYGAGAVRTLRMEQRRRAAMGASAVLARVWDEVPAEQSVADIWAGRIRVTLGGIEYALPVAPKRVAAAWIESLDERFATVASLMEAKEVPEALRILAQHTDALHDMLIDYAASVGVTLPARDSLEDYATAPEVLRATVGVWAALHPLAVALAQSEPSPTSGRSAPSTSSSPASTDGEPTTSTASSPTPRSSPTSTPRKTGSKPSSGASSRAGSKRSVSATSSPATASNTPAGARPRALGRTSAGSPGTPWSRP